MENEEWQDVDLTSQGTVCEPKNDKIALIDADTIVVAACSVHSYIEDLLPIHMYSKAELEAIYDDDGYNAKDHTMARINLDDAYAHAMEKIGMILQETGCQDYELHFTVGRESFRYTVDKEYKANRLDKKPIFGIGDLKNMFAREQPTKSYLHRVVEADDIVVARKKYNPDKYLLCAVDKDVIYSLEGRHFNYYSSTAHNILMKFVDVDSVKAMKHHYMQVLTGDPGDNIIGLHKVGPKTAEKMLADCKTHLQCWEAVVAEYEKRDRTELDAVINMRLVSMHQLDSDYQIVLWQPRKED